MLTTLTAAQPRHQPNFVVPEGACNTHVHAVGPRDQYPQASNSPYTVPPATVAELEAMLDALHLDRVVIVNTIVYRQDHSYLCAALRTLGERARGVAVIDSSCPDSVFDELDRHRVCGVRATISSPDTMAAARALAEHVRSRGWHLQILIHLPDLVRFHADLSTLPVPLVIDHLAMAEAQKGVGQPGFENLLDLLQSGRAYVKLSGLHRLSRQSPDYPDIAPLARAVVEANPQRVLWANDWPHTGADFGQSLNPAERKELPWYDVDDAHEFDLLASWIPDSDVRRAILVDNPARLYRF